MGARVVTEQDKHADSHREQESICAARQRPQGAQEPSEADQAGPVRGPNHTRLPVEAARKHTRH